MSGSRIYDRQTNFSDGMDSYHYAAELKRNQSQLIQNFIVLDNGRAVTRPGADLLAVNNLNSSITVNGVVCLSEYTITGTLIADGLYIWNAALNKWVGTTGSAISNNCAIVPLVNFGWQLYAVPHGEPVWAEAENPLSPPNMTQTWTDVHLFTSDGGGTLPAIFTTPMVISPVGPVQGIGFYDSMSSLGVPIQQLLMAQGGNFYSWNGVSWSGAIPSWPQGLNASASVSMAQGIDGTLGTCMLVSDGINPMALWNGTTFTSCGLANSSTNAPSGVGIVSQIAGMWVAAGNAMIQNSVSYPPDTLFFSNYLAGESGKWNTTQSIRVGNGDGEPIVGLASIQSTASSVPIYQLAVLKANSVWIVTINPQNFSTTGTPAGFAAMFAQLTANPQGDQVGTGIGCVGKNAYCLYQNDLLFFSQDGVQSLQRMQAAAGQYQLTAPLSEPIQNYIDRINWSFAGNIQAVKYRRWAIFFVPLDNSTVNNYALVWDGRIGQWMIWTGWTPSAAVASRFAAGTSYNGGFSQAGQQLILGNSDGSVTIWKDSPQVQYLSGTYFDNGIPIFQQLNSRAFAFQNFDFHKKPRAAQVRFNQGAANVQITTFLDSAQDDSYSESIAGGGAVLPVILPFVLGSSKPVQAYRSLLGNPYFYEAYIQITATSGWMDIREILMSAYLKSVTDPNA